MSERLKVTLAGGYEEYLDLAATSARGLEALIVQRRVDSDWLPIEGGTGVVRVDAIIGMKIEGRPDPPGKPESDKLSRLDDERRLAGKPPVDDRSLERRIH
jgi:hypothetical protein